MDYLRRTFRGEDDAVVIDTRLLKPEPPDSAECKECIRLIIEARQAAIQFGIPPKTVYLPDNMWEACKDKIRKVNAPTLDDDSPLPDSPMLFGMIVRRGPEFKVE